MVDASATFCSFYPQVRITSINKVRNYISYAAALLEEKGHTSVVLKAMGQAINKAVVVGETLAALASVFAPNVTVRYSQASKDADMHLSCFSALALWLSCPFKQVCRPGCRHLLACSLAISTIPGRCSQRFPALLQISESTRLCHIHCCPVPLVFCL